MSQRVNQSASNPINIPPTPPSEQENEDRRRWMIIAIAILGGILIAIILALLFRYASGSGNGGISGGAGGNDGVLGTGDAGNNSKEARPPSGKGEASTATLGVGEEKPKSPDASTSGEEKGTLVTSEQTEAGDIAFHIYESSAPVPPVATSKNLGKGGTASGKGAVYLGDEGSNPFMGDGMSAKSIVFVFDISASMATNERWPLVRACLIKALGKLKPNQKIKLIAFHLLTYPDPISQTGKLYPANKKNVDRAIQWINTCSLGAGTCPLQGMLMAIAQGPEVIYLLSDGEFTETTDCVEAITRANQQQKKPSIIHCIEVDRQLPNLQEIALRNGGTILHTITP